MAARIENRGSLSLSRCVLYPVKEVSAHHMEDYGDTSGPTRIHGTGGLRQRYITASLLQASIELGLIFSLLSLPNNPVYVSKLCW